tara:strand:- start:573 stop:1118 length:546 start_codon:yes stop_codon:yes gene_type:complete
MKASSLERYLNNFGAKVVGEAKKSLRNQKGNTALEKTIRFKVEPTAQGFETKFYMDDYGTYLDEGVSGTKVKRSFTDTKGKTRKSSYSYTTKGPPIDILSKWIKRKGIKPKGLGRGRSKNTGQYISGFAYLISRKIKRDGIKSLSFFQKPLGIEYTKLKKDILDILKLDIQNYITTFTKQK